MASTILTSLIAFISSNIDDIFILMLFFSQINNRMKKQHIILGQYLGIGILTAVSMAGALGISVIQPEYVGFLGLAPIYLGLKNYIEHKKAKEVKPASQLESAETEVPKKTLPAFIQRFINPSVVQVTAVTIANGGDNIGIYIPVFARMDLWGLLVSAMVFALLVALWCFIGFKLAEYPFVQENIEKYKHIFVPVIFIGLGIFILIENGTLAFICQWIA